MNLQFVALTAVASWALACTQAVCAPAPSTPQYDPLGMPFKNADMPIGRAGLAIKNSMRSLAPGVMHHTVKIGAPDPGARWQLSSDILDSEVVPAALRLCFDQLGQDYRSTRFVIGGSTARAPYFVVSGGRYATRAAAASAAERVAGMGCRLYPRHSSGDTTDQEGPWHVDIVTLDPAASQYVLAGAIGQGGTGMRTKTTTLVGAARALAGVNGGFFVERDEDGFPGQPAGISIVAGQIQSAPVTARPAVVLPSTGGARLVTAPDWRAELVWSDGARTLVDGINRKPGRVRNCGRAPGDKPVHDHTCRYDDDLVYFPAGSRVARAGDSGFRFAVAAGGTVRQLAPGESPRTTEAMLAAEQMNQRVSDIQQRVAAGTSARIVIDSSLLRDYGSAVSVINAGPTLRMAGRDMVAEADEGWDMHALPDASHKRLMHDWINRRNPRTAIGVLPDGKILLVTVDGHQHARSVGLTIAELRRLMLMLGAESAVNLDGGGSTTMAVRESLVNRPSDAKGERAVGDAIVLIRRAR